MRNKYLIIFFLLSISTLPVVFAAHWIIGYVQNNTEGISPNGRIVKLSNPTVGSDEINDTIGPSGNSLTSNIYMIDCELLNTSCSIGDNLSIYLENDSSGHVGLNIAYVNVTGAGYDVAINITMNSAPNITNVSVDDSSIIISEEIDLTPATQTDIYCTGIVEEFEGISNLQNVTGQFYSNTSFFGQTDDRNYHYSNNSCLRDDSYGNENQSLINCSFKIEYYANAGNWTCTLNATDYYNATKNQSDTIKVNTLLSIGVNNSINFSFVNANAVTSEATVEVINYGNVRINLSLRGYGNISGDGNSMNCDTGNISVGFMKYNITTSNPGFMNLVTFSSLYKNLTSNPVIENLNLSNRQNDIVNDAVNNTYWRVYVPGGIGTTCEGNIIFGATQN